MLTQHHARIREHDEAEVEADRPQGDDDAKAVHALGREDGVAQTAMAGCAGRGARRRASYNGVVTSCDGGGDDVDMRDVVLGGREAGSVGDGAAGAGGGEVASGLVLGEDDEPGYAEEGGVGEVNGGVDDVEPGEGEAVQGRLRADVGREECGEDEGDARVDVHAQLDGREVVAGKEGEEAVQPGDLVEKEGERDEGCAGREGHGVEEFLPLVSELKGWEIGGDSRHTCGRGRRSSRAEM